MTEPTRIRRGLQLLCGFALLLASWGFAALLALGLALDPTQLGRTTDEGAPLWPWLVGFLVVLLAIGAGGFLLARAAFRETTSLRPAPAPFSAPVFTQDTSAPHVASTPVSARTKLFLLAVLVLGGAAILAGMVSEWMGDEPQGFAGPGTLLALATLAGSFALGMAFARRMSVARAHRAADPTHVEGDLRPVMALIWWPITLIAVATPLLVILLVAVGHMGPGSGLPTGIILVVGVFGFVSLAPVVNESVAQFRARGVRGFWNAFRKTQWGDGSG